MKSHTENAFGELLPFNGMKQIQQRIDETWEVKFIHIHKTSYEHYIYP